MCCLRYRCLTLLLSVTIVVFKNINLRLLPVVLEVRRPLAVVDVVTILLARSTAYLRCFLVLLGVPL
jgi:hypothetical protein